MESRLPKPKVVPRKGLNTVNVNTEESVNGHSQRNKNLVKALSNEDIKNGTESSKKYKSTHNIPAQITGEMIVPQKPGLVRAKTHGIITRSTSTTRSAIKRPATANEPSENKKPNIKPAPKPIATSKVFRSTAATTTNKTNNLAATKAATKQRPKWDLKGRLEEASNELGVVKEKHKSIAQQNSELKSQIESLRVQEEKDRLKAEKYELESSRLTLEVTVLQNKNTDLQNAINDLSKEHVVLKEDLSLTKASLQSYQEKSEIQALELLKATQKLDDFKTENQLHKNAIAKLTQINDELQGLVHSMDRDRRQLHNTIQEMKGNIRVFCRVRPRIDKEISKGMCSMVFTDECTIEIGKSEIMEASTCGGRPRGTRQEFTFDKVFPPNSSQATVFEELALLVQSALEGYNVCVFAYGQTGSGKTYTMEGYPSEDCEGMIPRTVKHIFEEKKQFEVLGWEYVIEASFLEIYNEHIVDLLDDHPKTHEIRMTDSKGTDIYVTNLRIEQVNSPAELQDCLRLAQKNRAVAATHSNERSSRSHSVARIRLIGTHKVRNEVCTGTLNLVDLAGSERLRNDEIARTTETKNINKSLANLGNVILALLKKQDHVPYRNSKLTHLLMPSLGGNSKTLMLLNISPLDECFNETLNSLRFASNVNNCKTGSVRRTRATFTSSA
ncbi:protein claret segregational-like [Diprion similis]|uniref:protein claret segregational-like n=1 Tax=Diprion similis TaxID=362088 RepID=UPI001EF76C95|nr:protein claret segregational-like [Diprion similis]